MLPINRTPLIGHSIEIAKISKKIDKVFISTDCKEIAHAGFIGCRGHNRPPELASDTASEWDAWQHAIYYVEQKYGYFTLNSLAFLLRHHAEEQRMLNVA